MVDWSEGLNENQREAAGTTNGVLLVLAGAGSGKTRVMTHRICHLLQDGVSADSILGITFTNKAAHEMKERMEKMLRDEYQVPHLSTFHSYGYTLLKRFGAELGYKPHLGICDEEDRKKRIKEEMKSLWTSNQGQVIDLSKDSEMYEEVSSTISQWKDQMYSDEKIHSFLEKNDRLHWLAPTIVKIYEDYNRHLKEDNLVDFDDLISKAVSLLMIPHVRETLNREIRHVSVDEFQDTSIAQCKLIELLSEEPCKEEGSLCVVGDDYQSIYGFRGAEVENILTFSKRHPNCKTVYLGENYRSTGMIVDAAASVIARNTKQLNKPLFSMNETGERISVVCHEYDSDEAKYVANTIKTKVEEGQSPLDFAILYRNNAMSRKIEEAIITAGIPYKIFGGISFYQRMEIKDLVAYLRIAAGMDDLMSLKRIANVPKRKIGATSEAKIVEAIRSDRNDVSMLSKLVDLSMKDAKYERLANILLSFRRDVLSEEYTLSELLEKIVEDLHYYEYLKTVSKTTKEKDDDQSEYSRRKSNVEQLIEKAKEYTADYECKNEIYTFEDLLYGFLNEIALLSEIDTKDDSEYVSLMTMHKSKGLEFDTVFMINCIETQQNKKMSQEPKEIAQSYIEEERRLFYVAMTRAKKKLYLTYSKIVSQYGNKTTNNDPLQYIREIPLRYKESSIQKSTFAKEKNTINKYTRGYEYGNYGW